MAVPFTPSCHSSIDDLELAGIAWLGRFASPDVVEQVRKARAGRITARTCAITAPSSLLHAYTQMLEWGFWFDDEFVDDLPAASTRHLPAITSVLNILDGLGGTGAAGQGMEAAFQEVLNALDRTLTDQQFGLWKAEMRLWFASMTLQNTMRAASAAPSVAEYKTMRLYSVCTMPCIVIIDASWGEEADLQTYWSPQMTAMRICAANVVAWQNDVFSYFAERAHPGRFWNLPTLYMAHGLSGTAAVKQAAEDARDELTVFLASEAQISESMTISQSFQLRSLKNWMRGCHDWSHEAIGRYIGWES